MRDVYHIMSVRLAAKAYAYAAAGDIAMAISLDFAADGYRRKAMTTYN